MKIAKIFISIVLVSAFLFTANLSLADTQINNKLKLLFLVNGKWTEPPLTTQPTNVPVLPNLVVNNVNFYYENGGYYANPVIMNKGPKVKNQDEILTVSVKYNGTYYSSSAKYDCDYYPCGYVIGPIPGSNIADFEIVVDPDDKFKESNESDNVYIKHQELADFEVTDIKFDKSWWRYYAYVTIKNSGNRIKSPTVDMSGQTPYILVSAVTDDLGNYYLPKSSTRENYYDKDWTVTLKFGPFENPKKIKSISAHIDRTNIMTESNESNNTMKKDFNYKDIK